MTLEARKIRLLMQLRRNGINDTATHSGLTNGTSYRYSVFAIDSSGNVSLAAQAEGIPVDNVPPSEVLNLRRTDVYAGP